jgi:hypothetical protein
MFQMTKKETVGIYYNSGAQEISRASANDLRDWTNPGGIEAGFGLSENFLEAHPKVQSARGVGCNNQDIGDQSDRSNPPYPRWVDNYRTSRLSGETIA